MQIPLNAIHEGGNALGIWNFETSGLRRNHFINRRGARSWAHVAKGTAAASDSQSSQWAMRPYWSTIMGNPEEMPACVSPNEMQVPRARPQW